MSQMKVNGDRRRLKEGNIHGSGLRDLGGVPAHQESFTEVAQRLLNEWRLSGTALQEIEKEDRKLKEMEEKLLGISLRCPLASEKHQNSVLPESNVSWSLASIFASQS